jgi:hypothetical protein
MGVGSSVGRDRVGNEEEDVLTAREAKPLSLCAIGAMEASAGPGDDGHVEVAGSGDSVGEGDTNSVLACLHQSRNCNK